MEMSHLTVVFDDGPRVEVDPKSRDFAWLEREGIGIGEDTPPMTATYSVAFAALHRMKRKGDLDLDLPETVDALMDVADIEVHGDGDEGEGSGQEAATG